MPHPTRFDWQRWLPGLVTLLHYKAAWLPKDIAAGLVLTTMLVPVGIAYAEASGVPGIYGLYATIIPLLAYALFGPSRILVLGPDSALAAPILAVVVQYAASDPQRAIAIASMMALVAGAFCVIAGLFRLGFITELLSKPIRYGYMNGIALTVLISQLPKLFGIKVDSEGPLRDLWYLGQALFAGQGHWPSFIVGAGSLGLILLLKPFKRLPGILIAVVLATLAVSLFNLDQMGVKVLGQLPQGLPGFVFPWVSDIDLVEVLLGGIAVALVSFADTSVLSRSYAARLKMRVNPNQEMFGLGVANLASGLFQGIPISSSSSRTPVAEAAGSQTQLTGIIGALAVAVGVALYMRQKKGGRFAWALGLATLAFLVPLPESAAPRASAAEDLWVPFDQAAIPGLVEAGNTVFVDVTADWCITCQLNKSLVIYNDDIMARLSGNKVVSMQADWTLPSEAISNYLASFGRYAIPFDAVYGPGTRDGIVLPELLTKKAVTDALDRATVAVN